MAEGNILFKLKTALGSYEVVEMNYNQRPARVLYNSGRSAAQSGVAQDDNSDLLFDYNQRFLELVRGLRPKNILILGGGAFTLPTAIMHEFPYINMDIVELDGGLLKIAQEYFDFKISPHTRVHIGDGRKFIDKTNQKYDLIIMDVFDHADIPPHFQELEAAQSLRRCLNHDGVVAVNIIAALDGTRADVLQRLEQSLKHTFSNVVIYPAGYGLSPWISQNLVVTAQNGNQNLTPILRYPPIKT